MIKLRATLVAISQCATFIATPVYAIDGAIYQIGGPASQLVGFHEDGSVTYITPSTAYSYSDLVNSGIGMIFDGYSRTGVTSAVASYAGDIVFSTQTTVVSPLPLYPYSGSYSSAIQKYDNGTGTLVTLAESGVAGASDGSFRVYGVNANNTVTFSSKQWISADVGDYTQGIYNISTSGGVISTLASADPLGGHYISFGNFISAPTANGDMAFYKSYIDPVTNQFVDSQSSVNYTNGGGPITTIAYNNNSIPAPDGNGYLSAPNIDYGVLTDNLTYIGQVSLSGTSGGTSDNTGIFAFDSNGSVTQLVREGQLLTSDGAMMGDIHFAAAYDNGDIVFAAQINGTSVQGDRGLFRVRNGALTELARDGQVLSEGRVIQTVNQVYDKQAAYGDLVLFSANVSDGVSSRDALLMTDGTDTVEVAGGGASVTGQGILTNYDFIFAKVNEHGDVAFRAGTENGQGVMRFSPDLKWKGASGGSWEQGGNWTFGLNPGSNNGVIIDDATGSAVSGPVSDATVRAIAVGKSGGANSLTLGQGNIAVKETVSVGASSEINLNGKSMTVGDGAPETTADTMRIYSGGSLGGTGTIIGDVVNDGGTVGPGFSPGALTIDGNYTHTAGSILNIEISGLGEGLFDTLTILGDATFEEGSTINFDFIDGFAPTLGDSLDFFSATSVTGNLGLLNFTFSGLESGFTFDTSLNVDTFNFTALSDGVSTTSVSTVPIPATVWLFGSGLLGLIGVARKKAA